MTNKPYQDLAKQKETFLFAYLSLLQQTEEYIKQLITRIAQILII